MNGILKSNMALRALGLREYMRCGEILETESFNMA
jgi:hypothetical protein